MRSFGSMGLKAKISCGVLISVLLVTIAVLVGINAVQGIVTASCVVLVGALLCAYIIRMKRLLILIGFAIFSFGCIVYLASPDYVGENVLARSLAAANSSFSAFFPSRGSFEDSFFASNGYGCGCVETLSCGWRIAYWTFHIFAVLYVATIIVSVFGAHFCNRLLLKWRMSRLYNLFFGRSTVNVFWGVSAEAEATAEGLAAKEGKTVQSCDDIVFVLPDRKKSWLGLRDDEFVHAVARKRYMWIFASTEVPDILVKADRHFFLGGNGQENVMSAERLMVKLQRETVIGRSVSVYVRISANADDDIMYKWADKWNCVNDNVEVVVVREESLVSRRFLLNHPMIPHPKIACPSMVKPTYEATVSGEFKVLLIGFGAQGKVLLGDMICDAQCLSSPGNAVPIRVDVFDRSAVSFGWFVENCPDACHNYNISFTRKNVHCAEFWREMRSRITKDSHYNRVVVCTRDDRINIGIANDIAKLYREIGVCSREIVFARVRNKDVNGYLATTLEGFCKDPQRQQDKCERHPASAWCGDVDKEVHPEERGNDAPFTPFGRMTDTYSPDVVVVDKWDRGAMWLNWKWKGQEELSREELWRRTSFFDKESSRAAFLGQRKLLRLIGYDVDYKTTESKYSKADLTDNKLTVLAETEHLRWMAFHFVRGIKAWNTSDMALWPVSKDGKRQKAKANRIAEINAHAALVEFSKLPEVDENLWEGNKQEGMKGNLQQVDRDFVLAIVPAMKEAGFGIKRLQPDSKNTDEVENGAGKNV